MIDKLKVLKCSASVKKYPGNRMLGWREFINGKVFLVSSDFLTFKNFGI